MELKTSTIKSDAITLTSILSQLTLDSEQSPLLKATSCFKSSRGSIFSARLGMQYKGLQNASVELLNLCYENSSMGKQLTDVSKWALLFKTPDSNQIVAGPDNRNLIKARCQRAALSGNFIRAAPKTIKDYISQTG